jgi:hypothetical protein
MNGEKNMSDQDGSGGAQLGGGAVPSDNAAPGGSSGTGGYGNDQQSVSHQGQDTGATGHDERQSRGERFDEEQGGGRGPDSISDDRIAQVGGSDGSFDQHTNSDALSAAADELLGESSDSRARADFESDAQS